MFPALHILSPLAYGNHINLSGTLGDANASTDFDGGGGTATSGWIFQVDGTIDKYSGGSPAEWAGRTGNFEEWTGFKRNPEDDLWLAMTLYSGDAATTLTGGDGVWNKISGSGEALAQMVWTQSGTGTLFGIYRVDIATDSGGSNIIATGYFSGSSIVESGA